jgi:hypothetical protein
MIAPRCLIGVSDSRASFQADFAAQGNGFVGTRGLGRTGQACATP